MMFQTVGIKGRLVDRVMEEIQGEITGGSLKPGMMLPSERELCDLLGVSRTVLREAVRMLVTKGLLETRAGIGTIVRKVTGFQVIEPLSLLVNQADDITLDHLHQVRQILEVEFARLAAIHATDDDIGHLSAILSSMEDAQADPLKFTALDTEFHRALSETTHNPLLVILLDSVRELMIDVRLMVQEYHDLARLVLLDHRAILEKIKDEDAQGAASAMGSHLEHALQIQLDYLASKEQAGFSGERN